MLAASTIYRYNLSIFVDTPQDFLIAVTGVQSSKVTTFNDTTACQRIKTYENVCISVQPNMIPGEVGLSYA